MPKMLAANVPMGNKERGSLSGGRRRNAGAEFEGGEGETEGEQDDGTEGHEGVAAVVGGVMIVEAAGSRSGGLRGWG